MCHQIGDGAAAWGGSNAFRKFINEKVTIHKWTASILERCGVGPTVHRGNSDAESWGAEGTSM